MDYCCGAGTRSLKEIASFSSCKRYRPGKESLAFFDMETASSALECNRKTS
jgi:hypothetical protein